MSRSLPSFLLGVLYFRNFIFKSNFFWVNFLWYKVVIQFYFSACGCLVFLTSVFFLFFFFFGCTHGIWKFPDQGLNPSCSCNAHHSCGNAQSLTHCARPEIKPALLQRKHQILNPLCHSGNSPNIIYWRDCSSPLYILGSWNKLTLYAVGLFFWLSILFHWPMCLFLCQYDTV